MTRPSAVQPYGPTAPVPLQPSGSDVIVDVIGSKKVSLRATPKGTTVLAPASPVAVGPPPGVSAKVPRGPIFETSSSGSCVESGSVAVFQLRLPRKRSAPRTSAGV